MKIIIEVNNESGCDIEKYDLDNIVKSTIQKGGFDFLREKNIEISLGIITEEEIKKINNKYRKIDKPTDVLSFPNYASAAELQKEAKQSLFLGEVLVCCEDVKKYAKIKNSFFDKELIYVISHGVLHLLGMSHGDKMFSIQKEVANENINLVGK